ncbi:T9SS type A sorting domain-containing protein [Hwangdonia seohaensis]|uniref:T9SS type A sorting domain-containing protein n=1 Tax=Hwangdonia seohaensis TaxID=1240727 RepID=A0ABW3RAC7_9FLAO|nr:T9SS type A sorting domain-containing protein [Hwangdonia seohaensis]
MKKLITSVLLCSAMNFYGQSIVKISIDSGGASAMNGNMEMIYTIGEVNLQEYNVSNYHVSEGFIDNSLFKSLGMVDETIPRNSIKIYPNPVSQFINIKSTIPVNYTEVYDVLGSKILTTTKIKINVNHLQSGLYLLKIFSENKQVTKKIIIK